MAYQRPFLISLKRNNPQEPWGFRTFGGKEYGEPHVVEKVVPDSIAERCGVREGDEIIQIGRANIQDSTFGQVQELMARSGNKIEMFVIREDLLSPRKGKEPSHVKAVVHNPYNSPLNLYSTENIAETLAKQAEVLTEGHVSSAEEEDAPENLSFKQKSAVFQLLEEQARQENVNQYQSRANIQRKAPPPPPKAPPSAAQYYQNKENYSPQEQLYNSMQLHQHQPPVAARDSELYTRKPPTEYSREEHKHTNFSVQSQQSIQLATTNHYTNTQHQTSEYRGAYKAVSPPSPVQEHQTSVTTAHFQPQQQSIRQQPQSQETYHQRREKQQMQQQQQWQTQHHGGSQQQQKQHQHQTQSQYQQHAQHQQPKIQHYQNEVQRTESQSPGSPILYKAPPSQKNRVNWPPTNPAQQNGRWSSPSPTPPSPTKTVVGAMWPPKQPTVRELPKTGFNPAVLKDQGAGRRCVWPPPKPDDEFRSGRTTPQSPVTGRRIAWNPSPSPPPVRRSPFGSASPVTRRKDIAWPPPQPTAHKIDNMQHRPSPTLRRKANFDDYVKQHASTNVPSTYRPPPGTQRVEYA